MEAAGENVPRENPECVQPDNNNDEKPTTAAETSCPQGAQKKAKKEDKKKDDKSVEQLMKSLNSLPTLEEKFSMVCKKHVQSAEDLKKMQFYIKQSDKRYAMLLKEKEQLQHEFNKTILVKSKLENLCRELQKQNKAIKEESLLKIREEEERRKETQAKFQNTLSEITTLLQQNNEKNAKLRDDNISMSEKFKSVVQQYQLREQQVDKMAKQMALESQLSEAKLQKANLEHQAEKERLIAEMEQLKVTVAQYRAKVMELQGTETALRGQLGVYTDKYDEFQNALVKSNQVFGGFKEQMEKMSKKIKKLEKESLSWKKRWETSQTALLDMCGERQASEERAAAASRQLQHMQSLCRTLQGERTLLLNTLKEHNIERPALPPMPAVPAPVPAPTPASNTKVDAMAANCAQLRQSLAHLQSQLNVLTNNKNANSANATPAPETTEPPKPESKKKSKSKKNKAEKQAQKEAQEKSEGKEESNDVNAKEREVTEATANGSEVDACGNKATVSDNETTVSGNETTVSGNDIIVSGNDTTVCGNDTTVSGNDTTVSGNVITISGTGTTDNGNEGKDSPLEKVDDQTLETLIQAINSANINLCDLEVINDDDNIDIDNNIDELDIKINEENGQIDSSSEVGEIKNAEEKLKAVLPVVDTKVVSNEEVSQINEVKPIVGDSA